MAVTIQSAQHYTINNASEVAHEITYTDGTVVRCIESAHQIIRKEWRGPKGWTMVGKPYVVQANKKRDAEKIKAAVVEWLAA